MLTNIFLRWVVSYLSGVDAGLMPARCPQKTRYFSDDNPTSTRCHADAIDLAQKSRQIVSILGFSAWFWPDQRKIYRKSSKIANEAKKLLFGCRRVLKKKFTSLFYFQPIPPGAIFSKVKYIKINIFFAF